MACLAWIAPGIAIAGASVPVTPCDPNKLGDPYLNFIYGGGGGQALDPATACSALDNNCAKVDDFRAGNEGNSISVCRLVYEHMKAAAERYRQEIGGNYCQSVTQLGKGCPAAQGPGAACLSAEAEQHEQKEKEILGQLMSDYKKLRDLQLDKKIQQLQAKLNQDKTSLRNHAPLSCDKDVNGVPIPPQVFASQLQLAPANRGSAQSQLNELKRRASDFASTITKSTRDHQIHVTNFHSILTKSAALAKKLGTVDPNKPSDVTGTEKSPAQAQQQSGGGSQGGGQPGGGGGDSGQQASSGGVPGESGAGGVGPATMGPAGKDDGGNRADGSGGSTDGAKPVVPQARQISSTGAPILGSSVGSSGANPTTPFAASSFGSGGASSPSRASASGGGSGGGLGSGDSSSSDSRCSGKDCQAIGSAGMFGGVGALGSGSPSGGAGDASSGGLAPLDTASLDNLFKDDKNKPGAAPGALDANMAGLDASTASLTDGAAPAADGATQGGNDIGSADNDLFTRLHDFHVRAQKAGRIVGMTRKL